MRKDEGGDEPVLLGAAISALSMAAALVAITYTHISTNYNNDNTTSVTRTLGDQNQNVETISSDPDAGSVEALEANASNSDQSSNLHNIYLYLLGIIPPTVGVILGYFLSRKASQEADREIQRYLHYDHQSIKAENYSLKQEIHQKDEQIRQLMASRSPQDD